MADFVSRHFENKDRPELATIRKKKAEERLARDGMATPAYFRMKLGLSQQQLADAISSSQAAIARLENGQEKPGFDKLEKLKSTFGVTYDELMEAVRNASS
ncbi:helix-turn-helix transcriptional regulator [Alteriqipengyuania sp. WL0013]|uniref:helix-turn-helix domain-containing protein n=1 Tax=Alteriqipengyuania sp. WL0013 TaxID=3110773 RepID=UPI002BC7C003|nr:helix-turn-helix transcriptional regulator [Alteriqipengyuania sp. WL0013]MEB3416047.1 helix-turn-helix transcriptional regulator [Alteriqipengyuania sp. WL0013]